MVVKTEKYGSPHSFVIVGQISHAEETIAANFTTNYKARQLQTMAALLTLRMRHESVDARLLIH